MVVEVLILVVVLVLVEVEVESLSELWVLAKTCSTLRRSTSHTLSTVCLASLVMPGTPPSGTTYTSCLVFLVAAFSVWKAKLCFLRRCFRRSWE